jgi:YVTN family beta-propeller protein
MLRTLFMAAALVLALAHSSLAQNAYIANYGSSNVSVIDTTSGKVTATIGVGRDGPYAVAVSPDGHKVYVTTFYVGTVQVIDTATNAVTSTIDVGGYPYSVAVSPDGSKLYVSNYAADGTLSVIDTATNTVTATLSGIGFGGVAVAPNGSRVYISAGFVRVINTATNTLIATIPVPGEFKDDPQGLAVTPDGSKIYVASFGAEVVAVIDTATNTVTATIGVHSPSEGGLDESVTHAVAVSPDGSRVYVTIAGGVVNGDGTDARRFDSVAVIDTATNTVIAAPAVGVNPLGVSVTPDGSRVYVTNWGDNNVSVIDTTTNTVIGAIATGVNPVAFGNFIQPAKPAPKFAGTPGHSNCYGKSISALGGLNNAAAALGFDSVSALQNAIVAFCGG